MLASSGPCGGDDNTIKNMFRENEDDKPCQMQLFPVCNSKNAKNILTKPKRYSIIQLNSTKGEGDEHRTTPYCHGKCRSD